MRFSELQTAWLARAAELGYSLIRDGIETPAAAADPDLPKDITDAILRILEEANTEGNSLAYKPLTLVEGNSVCAATHRLEGAPRGVETTVSQTPLKWIEINGQPIVGVE